nr:cation-transporting P-type ATPase [uncultured Desulfobacter sp.]
MSSQGKQIQNLTPDRVYTLLETNPEGLHGDEVAERLLNVGRNSFDIPDRWKMLRNFAKQFTNFFTILLIVSAIICFVAHRLNPGESMNFLGWALLVVALLNAFFSFIQEYRAERAMEALKKFLPQMVEVQRQGQVIKVSAEEIVPGDLLILAEGDKITADARVVEAEGLLVDNAPLTGEANPCILVHGASSSRLVESNNIAFAGCTVIRGSGKAVVFATGLRTEFGKLAHLSQEIKRSSSPLEHETAHMVRVLTVIAVSMGFAFFMYGMVTGKPLWVNLVFMMGIIVANVPEGLLPTFTLSLAMGSLRMARKNVLVKSLNAVEALGAVHVICSDKTGTLTENRLTITELLSPMHGRPLADQEQLDLLTLALAASEVRGIDHLSGDPLDVAVAERLTILGADIEALREQIEHYFTFDVEKRRSAGIMTIAGRRFFVVKGAFEALSPMVVSVRSAKGQEVVNARVLGQAEEVLRGMAGQGLRVIALACRELEEGAQDFSSLQDALEKELVLVGFIGIEDPLRKEVPEAVHKCHTAGIDVLLITGDHPDTAQAIARKAGILPQEDDPAMLMTGADLEHLTEAGLMERLGQGTRVFARTTPEQKMKIVAALKTMEKVVAMTGDGVNDAPALKAADVGIAMGRQGTDVARESAQIILLDDNFASIVAGIEEGRTVFENIKKFTNYVLVSNGPEILPYLLYILLPVPLALNVIHILSIDLGTDIIPSMALGQEPPDSETMNQPPRLREQGLLTLSLIMHSYLFLGLLEGLWSLGLFFYVLTSGGWRFGEELATTDPLYHSAMGIALSTILLMQIGNLLGRRFARRSGLDGGIFKNRLMLLGIVIQVVFSWATLYFPPLQKILNTGPVPVNIYFLSWFGIILIFGSDYLRKRYLENREKASFVER